MINPVNEPQLRVIYLGEMSVPARSVLRQLAALPEVSQVFETTDPAMLQQQIDAYQPDLILIDFGITESSAQRYRPQLILPAITTHPVLALTSTEREQRGIRAVLQGAQQYLCTERMDEAQLRQALVQTRDQFEFVDTLSGRNDALAAVMDSLQDGTIVVNPAGRVVSVNPAARRLLDLDRDVQPDSKMLQQFCAYDAHSEQPLAQDQQVLARIARGERFNDLQLLHRAAGGDSMVFSVSGRGLFNGAGDLIGGIASFRDNTEQFRRESELAKMSLFDGLTGIANRRLFSDQLDQAVSRAQRSQRTLGVMFVDLDRFKAVNDSLGHDVGDALLCQAAERMQTLLRHGDLLARWGGDEFVVCIENLTSPRDAAAAAQKIVRGMSECFTCQGNEIYISTSVGIALYPEAGADGESLIRAADKAMYEAKRNGGARLQFFSTSQANFDNSTAELEIGIRHALLRRELTLRYQPRINLSNGRLMGLETLLRWQHPRFGLLPPSRFLSLLESSGLIHSVGEWIIDSVCAQLHSWQQRYQVPDLTVSINLSPMQLATGRLVTVVERAISDNNLDPGCIEFELGDGAASLQRPREVETLKGLRKLGVGVTLDHFGTHDISFTALDSTMVSSFVLHQSLIQDVTENEAHQRIVRAAIAMAEGLNIEVAAEGVETHDQLEFLRNSRCGSAQGFYISRPMDSEKVCTLLHTESLGGKLLEPAASA